MWLYSLFILLLVFVTEGCGNKEHEVIIDNSISHLQKLRIGGLDLSPVFEISKKHYVSTATFSVSKINLQAWTKFADDSVSVNGKHFDEYAEYNLAVGNNQFKIIVTGNNGEQEQYLLTVTRLTEMASNN